MFGSSRPIRRHLSLVGCVVVVLLFAGRSVSAGTFRVEIDYMVDDDHTHKPGPAVIAAVPQMFACQGHTLIVDADDAIEHYDVLARDPSNCVTFFDYDGEAGSFGALRDAYADHTPAGGWHYCIFGHQYEDGNCNPSGSSGLAELSGWNLFVSLGAFDGETGTPFERASTLAHEFGHNLGLTHCGAMNCATNFDNGDPDWVGPYPPNVPSIMSYRYQLSGLRTTLLCAGLTVEAGLFKEMDYSHGRMCTLDENSLDEPLGTVMRATDWNCDMSLNVGVVQDINGSAGGWCGSTGNTTMLNDYDEWANIADPADDLTDTPPTVVSCMTVEERDSMRQNPALGSCDPPALTTEPWIASENVYVGVSSGPQSGTCDRPYRSVQLAHDASPEDSVFYLLPAQYVEMNPVHLTKPGRYVCGALGSAKISINTISRR